MSEDFTPQLLTSEDVFSVQFPATKFRDGYDQNQIDDYLDEVVRVLSYYEALNASPEAEVDLAYITVRGRDVREVDFDYTRMRVGYDQDAVDDYLDQVAATLEAYENLYGIPPSPQRYQVLQVDGAALEAAATEQALKDGELPESPEVAVADATTPVPVSPVPVSPEATSAVPVEPALSAVPVMSPSDYAVDSPDQPEASEPFTGDEETSEIPTSAIPRLESPEEETPRLEAFTSVLGTPTRAVLPTSETSSSFDSALEGKELPGYGAVAQFPPMDTSGLFPALNESTQYDTSSRSEIPNEDAETAREETPDEKLPEFWMETLDSLTDPSSDVPVASPSTMEDTSQVQLPELNLNAPEALDLSDSVEESVEDVDFDYASLDLEPEDDFEIDYDSDFEATSSETDAMDATPETFDFGSGMDSALESEGSPELGDWEDSSTGPQENQPDYTSEQFPAMENLGSLSPDEEATPPGDTELYGMEDETETAFEAPLPPTDFNNGVPGEPALPPADYAGYPYQGYDPNQPGYVPNYDPGQPYNYDPNASYAYPPYVPQPQEFSGYNQQSDRYPSQDFYGSQNAEGFNETWENAESERGTDEFASADESETLTPDEFAESFQASTWENYSSEEEQEGNFEALGASDYGDSTPYEEYSSVETGEAVEAGEATVPEEGETLESQENETQDEADFSNPDTVFETPLMNSSPTPLTDVVTPPLPTPGVGIDLSAQQSALREATAENPDFTTPKDFREETTENTAESKSSLPERLLEVPPESSAGRGPIFTEVPIDHEAAAAEASALQAEKTAGEEPEENTSEDIAQDQALDEKITESEVSPVLPAPAPAEPQTKTSENTASNPRPLLQGEEPLGEVTEEGRFVPHFLAGYRSNLDTFTSAYGSLEERLHPRNQKPESIAKLEAEQPRKSITTAYLVTVTTSRPLGSDDAVLVRLPDGREVPVTSASSDFNGVHLNIPHL